jgi:hypothetical protein
VHTPSSRPQRRRTRHTSHKFVRPGVIVCVMCLLRCPHFLTCALAWPACACYLSASSPVQDPTQTAPPRQRALQGPATPVLQAKALALLARFQLFSNFPNFSLFIIDILMSLTVLPSYQDAHLPQTRIAHHSEHPAHAQHAYNTREEGVTWFTSSTEVQSLLLSTPRTHGTTSHTRLTARRGGRGGPPQGSTVSRRAPH